MNSEEISVKLFELLKGAGEAISQGAGKVFEIYTKQSLVDGIGEIAIGLLLIIMSIVAITLSTRTLKKRGLKKTDYDMWDDVTVGMAVVVMSALFIISMIGLPLSVSGVKKIINPQYYTIERLIDKAQNK